MRTPEERDRDERRFQSNVVFALTIIIMMMLIIMWAVILS